MSFVSAPPSARHRRGRPASNDFGVKRHRHNWKRNTQKKEETSQQQHQVIKRTSPTTHSRRRNPFRWNNKWCLRWPTGQLSRVSFHGTKREENSTSQVVHAWRNTSLDGRNFQELYNERNGARTSRNIDGNVRLFNFETFERKTEIRQRKAV